MTEYKYKLIVQFEHNGERWDLWYTNETDIEEIVKEFSEEACEDWERVYTYELVENKEEE